MLAPVRIFLIVDSYLFITNAVLDRVNMQVIEHRGLIKEVIDSLEVFTSSKSIFEPSPPLEHTWQIGHFLVVAWLVNVVDNCQCFLEFGIHPIPYFLAPR